MISTQDIMDRDTSINEMIRHRKQHGADLNFQLINNAELVIAINADDARLKESITENDSLIAQLESSLSSIKQNGSKTVDMETLINEVPPYKLIDIDSTMGRYLMKKHGHGPEIYGYLRSVAGMVFPIRDIGHQYDVTPPETIITRGTDFANYVLDRYTGVIPAQEWNVIKLNLAGELMFGLTVGDMAAEWIA